MTAAAVRIDKRDSEGLIDQSLLKSCLCLAEIKSFHGNLKALTEGNRINSGSRPYGRASEAVDASGCSTSQLDSDGDGVHNAQDLSPNTIPGTPVAADGCDDSQRDSDGDGVLDTADAFPHDSAETADLDGDGIGDNSDPDPDPDRDGVDNGADVFPNDPKETADLDGDGIGDNSDDDRDGVLNISDAFPNNPDRSTLPIITIDTQATLITEGHTPITITGTVDQAATALKKGTELFNGSKP